VSNKSSYQSTPHLWPQSCDDIKNELAEIASHAGNTLCLSACTPITLLKAELHLLQLLGNRENLFLDILEFYGCVRVWFVDFCV
jgi:hypothetical protein